MTYIEETDKQIKSLSPQQKEFYQLVGLCIKAWATVEDKLFDICELVLKTNQQLVAIIFYRSPTIDTRLKLTSEIIDRRIAATREKGRRP